MISSLNPIAPSSRHEIVDVVRGFALFGVLIANMVYTAEWFATPEQVREALPTARLDEIVGLLLIVFVDSKFITLFSMLFGLGLAMQVRRARARGQALAPTFLRRMLVLWIIGVAHSALVWSGDILQYYAVVGVVLLLASRFSLRVIVAAGIGLGVVCSLLPVVSWLLSAGGAGAEALKQAADEIDPWYLVMTEGAYLDVIRMNLQVMKRDYASIFTNVASSAVFWYLSPLWKALLGYAIGMSGVHERSAQLLGVARRLLPWTLAFGVGGCMIPAVALIGWDLWLPDGGLRARLFWAPFEFAAFLLAIAYACGLVILWNRAATTRIVGLFAPVGRMALTNYVMQSVLFVLLLYGIGLGLIGRVGTTACVGLSVAIFCGQVVVSAWWLRFCRFGPLEWAWRSLTYLKPQPIRRP